MEHGFWRERWSEGRISFHEGRTNKYLERHAGRVHGHRVLVPLCGKTEDLAFLAAQGHAVIGIELVEDAARAFFAEHGASPAITAHGPLVEYTADAITILAGDVFAATRELVGVVDAVYDRAALIALPPELRPRYVEHLRALAGAGASGLLITVEYPEDAMSGPPWSVREAELGRLYAEVELVEEGPAASGGKLKEKGVSALERCYAVRL